MSVLQYSFNSHRHWIGRRNSPFGHPPANQFSGFMPVEVLRAQARVAQIGQLHETEDHLVVTFLVFFLIYALCRITL